MVANLDDDRKQAKANCTTAIQSAVVMARLLGSSVDQSILIEEIEVALYDAAIASTVAAHDQIEMNDTDIQTCRRLSRRFRLEAREEFGL